MKELSEIREYEQFKEALGTELRNQAEGFVRTGYLLKVARDTDILKDSGYETVAEFALAEYGLSKDIVSRYIAINDRYSIDGYSEFLQEKFEGYGVAKLQEMLTMPDSVVELMSPDMTKREIQDIKKEVKDAEKISELEIYLEGEAPDQEHMTTLQKVIHKYFHEQKEQYISLEEVISAKLSLHDAIEKVLNVLAPSGIAVKAVRVQGVGKLIISFKGKENDIEMLNVITNEKESITWKQFLGDMVATFGGRASVQDWERIYGESFEEKEELQKENNSKVAPVQQPVKKEKPAAVIEPEQQIEGQDNIMNHPEYLPEGMQAQNEEEKEDGEQTDTDTVTGLPEGSGAAGDAVESGENAEIPGETEDTDTGREPDAGTGTAEGGGCETDSGRAEDNQNVIAGYKAGISSGIKRLEILKQEERWDSFIQTMDDMKWRVEQIKKLQGGC